MKQIPVWQNVDKALFNNQILPKNEPAILKGLVDSWPAVVAAKKSDRDLVDYLKPFDQGKIVPMIVGPSSINGRFNYQDDMKRYNFVRKSERLSIMLEGLLDLKTEPEPEAVSAQGLNVDEYLPGFAKFNNQQLLSNPEVANAWVGNKTITTTHYDHVENIACVVAGNRRFTLFPPAQLPNLYVGPLLATPAGPPISMVELNNPDFTKYPKFKTALDNAYQADLEPGDAIFIPFMWWHNVESLSDFNLLVNYWWAQTKPNASNNSAYQCMLFSMMSIPELPLEHRKIWQEFFNHYVFQLEGKPDAHLTADIEDIITGLSKERKENLKQLILSGVV